MKNSSTAAGLTKETLLADMRKEFPDGGWKELGSNLEQVLDVVQTDKRGWRALAVLMKAGCNPAVLLRELLMYCGSDLGVLENWEKKTAYAKKQLMAITAQLDQNADIIESIAREVMVDDEYGPYAPAFHIPASLRRSAQYLQDALAALKKHTHGKTGKTKRLVYLSYHISAATKRPHYKEIASLVASVRRDTSCNLVSFAEAIRRTIKRHEQDNPEFFAGERSDILNHLDQWRRRRASSGDPDTR
jgi:hypothetical protein